MTIQFKSAGTAVDGSASLVITRPSISEGDLIKISVVMDTEDGTAAISGFTEVINLPHPSDDMRLQIFTKVAGVSEPTTYTITSFVGGAKATIELYEDSIGGGSWAVGTAISATGTGAVNVGPLTTSNNSILLGTWGNDSDSTVSSAPSGMTLTTNGPTGGTTVATHSYYESITTGGSDSRSLTYSLDATSGVLFELTYTGGAPSASVDDINTTEITEDGEIGVTFTTTGFAGEINSIKIVSGTAETVCTNISSTGGAGTFDIPDVTTYTIDTNGAPFTAANNAIVYELSDGTDTATLAGTHNPKTGYAVQEITSAVKTTGSVYENFVPAIPDTSVLLYPTANSTSVSATGIITTDSVADISMFHWDATLENHQPFDAIIAGADTTVPVITLVGNSTINVTVDTSYVDQGATATDNIDGVITGSIVTVNPVNIAIIAQYTVTYNVDDAAANSAVQVTRTVNVQAAAQTETTVHATPVQSSPITSTLITGAPI